MSHYLSGIAFDANDGKPHLKAPPRPRLAVDLEKARRFAEESFHAGTLAALDVVYLHDQQVIAREIVHATDATGLLRHATKEKYHNLTKLRATMRELRRFVAGAYKHRATKRVSDSGTDVL